MTIRLRLTDYQLAVAGRLRHQTGALTFTELAISAVEHALDSPPEPGWERPRPGPRRPGRGPRLSEARLDAVLPAATAVSLPLTGGQTLRLEQLKDGQCVDLAVHAAGGRSFSAARTRMIHGIRPTVGATLWSTPPEARLLSITADSAPGHDLGFPPCSAFEYERHAGIGGHLGCAELHAAALTRSGRALPASEGMLNLWLPSAVDGDGSLRSWPAACRRGDFVELVAHTDVVITLSACPDDLFGSSQYEPGPVRVIVSGGPSGGVPQAWPAGAPDSALARNEVDISLTGAPLAAVDRIRALGWLGTARMAVVRALIFRMHEAIASSAAARPRDR